jgi:MFS transporter, PHS family, inorganic phosphate transporter
VSKGHVNVLEDMLIRFNTGFGAVPACIALYYRLTIPETPRYTFDVARDVEKGGVDVQAFVTGKWQGAPDEIRRIESMRADQLTTPKASWGDFVHYYSKRKHFKVLLGTAGSWFAIDVAFYGLGLNTSTVLNAIGYNTGNNVYETLYKLGAGQAILVCAGSIPGYWCTVAFVDIVGRKPIQMMGFVVLTILFLVWGFDFANISPNAMFAIYVLSQFFTQFGMSYPSQPIRLS